MGNIAKLLLYSAVTAEAKNPANPIPFPAHGGPVPGSANLSPHRRSHDPLVTAQSAVRPEAELTADRYLLRGNPFARGRAIGGFLRIFDIAHWTRADFRTVFRPLKLPASLLSPVILDGPMKRVGTEV